MRFRSRELSIGQQVATMLTDFPSFKYRREKQIPTWRGTLQPTESSPIYRVKVVYRYPRSPQVWVGSPTLQPDAPHRYKDGSLCLYYPHDGSWTPFRRISHTFVPWTALWLAFYEIWLHTSKWYGPEVSHEFPRNNKRQAEAV